MTPKSKMWAVACVFLLLGAHPIEAARRQEAGNVMQGGLAGSEGASFGASCETLKERFENHAATMSTSVGLAQNTTGRPGYLNTAAVLLRAVRMTRTLQRAGNRGCEWAEHGEANTAPLMQIVQQTQATNPCLPRAQQLMSGESSDADEEFDTFVSAMQVLVSPTCDLDLPEGESEEDPDPAEVEEDTEGEADVLSAEVMEDIELGEGASLLESENPILEWIAEHTWPPPAASGSEYLSVGGEVATVIEGTGPSSTGQWLWHIVGAASWLIAFAVLCTLAVHAIAWVVTAVFCLLRFVLGLIFRRGWSLTSCVRGTMARIRNSRSGQNVIMGGCAIGGGALMAGYGGVTVIPGIPIPPPFPR